ncbi:MAG TPA: Holliday junction resolvase RuvX [Candidatus Wallbacteria bacterium]|nr:Holliday junction resolvase RuvX [Candidatus Wallbacteria bacterium]
MAIDYGTARIGVAVSDRTLTISANSITVKNDGRAIDAIAGICRTEEITNVVIGLPLNREGAEGDMCGAAREFGEKLENKFEYGEVRIEFFDERMTTRASNSILIEANLSRKKRKSVVDGLAAKIILQKFLDDRNLNINK